MEMFTKVIGEMIKRQVREHIPIWMVLNMLEIEIKISKKEKVLKHGQMVRLTLVTIDWVQNMVLGNFIGLINHNTRELSKRMEFMGKASILGLIEEYILASGNVMK